VLSAAAPASGWGNSTRLVEQVWADLSAELRVFQPKSVALLQAMFAVVYTVLNSVAWVVGGDAPSGDGLWRVLCMSCFP
jgi:hypothetical protein